MPAASKKRGFSSQELILCHALVSEWDLQLSVIADPKQPPRSTCIVAHCVFDEPIGKAHLLDLRIEGVDPERLESALGVGAVSAMKPVVRATLYLTHRELQVIASFAGGNQKTYLRLVLEPPHYGQARIKSASFSGRRDAG